MTTIRQALREDFPWINARYQEVGFVPSDEADYVAIAEVNDQPAGIGRLVDLEGGQGELGGMYVFENYRGFGISRTIIEHLLDNANHELLYCLPFENLEGLYASFGFQRVIELDDVPNRLLEKYRWCNKVYSKPVLLMKLVLRERAI